MSKKDKDKINSKLTDKAIEEKAQAAKLAFIKKVGTRTLVEYENDESQKALGLDRKRNANPDYAKLFEIKKKSKE